MGWVIDLDGVMWLAESPIEGSGAAIARLLDAGEDVLFVTNNSGVPVHEVVDRLAAVDVAADGRVVTSAHAAASLVAEGERALVCAGPGVTEALEAVGARIVGAPTADGVDDPDEDANGDAPPVDVVVVGLTRMLTYDLLARATLAVRGGARLLATNDDATYPTPRGQLPGGGAILAAVVTATGATPEVAGKPHAPMADLVRRRLGSTGIVVGDRPSTDGAFAVELGYEFGLVLSGVTQRDDLPVEPTPSRVAPDLAALVAQVLDGA